MIHYVFDPGWATRSAREFTEYVAPLLAERRREPSDDMISMLIGASTEEGESLTGEQIFTFLRMLFPLGADTTMLALGNILSAPIRHHPQCDADSVVRARSAQLYRQLAGQHRTRRSARVVAAAFA
jgi:cytochrome P450